MKILFPTKKEKEKNIELSWVLYGSLVPMVIVFVLDK